VLLAIHNAGDIFGKLCLSGLGSRLETATAMEDTILKQRPSSRDSLFEGFVRYLAVHCRPAAGDRQYGDGG
jgi:hypothetical protein